MKTLIKQGDQCPYTQIPNELIEDKTICPQTRFLYVIIRSQANDWEFFQKEISKRFNISKVHYTRGLTELEERGWIRKERTRTSSGTLGGWTITVYNIRNQTTQLNQPCGESTMMVKTDDITIRTGEQEEPKEQICSSETNDMMTKDSEPIKQGKNYIYPKDFDLKWNNSWQAGVKMDAFRAVKKAMQEKWTLDEIFEKSDVWRSYFKNAGWAQHVSTWVNSRAFTQFPKGVNSAEPERWGQYA